MYQALYRKWRPKTFEDVVGQEHITDILRSQVVSGRVSHAYLFTGTRGTGKTTCAKILSKAVNCLSPVNGSPCNACASCVGIDNGSIMDIVEMDAASSTSVENVRALRDEAVFTPASVRMRVYIVDEVHMLSSSAFNALLKIMEEPPEHLMFILATTEVHKVPATVLSRCQRFAFRRLPAELIEQRLMYVASSENISLDPDAASLLSRMSDGAMRDALSLLDQCACVPGPVDVNRVYETVGIAGRDEIKQLLFAVLDSRTGDALDILDRIYFSGANLPSVIDELSELFRDMLIYKCSSGGRIGMEGVRENDVRAKADAFSTRVLMDILGNLRQYRNRAKYTSDELVDTQLCIMELCSRSQADTGNLLRRVELLEQKLEKGGSFEPYSERIITDAPTAHEKTDAPEVPIPVPMAQEEPAAWQSAGNAEVLLHGDDDTSGVDGKQEEKKAPTAGRCVTNGQFDWKQVLEKAKPQLSFADLTTLDNPSLVTASMESGVLRIKAQNDFVLLRLRDEKLRAILKGASGASFVALGDEDVPGTDRFEELISLEGKYDNIIIKQ